MPISASAAAAGFLVFAACLFSFLCAYRFARGQGGAGRGPRLLAGGGVAVLALGCRLCIAEGHVSWAPYLDQWSAEISGVVAPLAHGHIGLRDLFAANNEHRVVLTRIASLAAVTMNGGWDNRVMVILTFALQSAAAAWVCLAAWSVLGWLRGSLAAAAAFLPMLLVCDWENVVSGFQDQFGMMVLGTVVALSLQEGCTLGSRGCWGALAAAAVLLGTMASGFLTAAAMAGTGLVLALAGLRPWRSCAGFLGACAAIAALGWFTRHPFAPMPSLYAQGPGAWMSAFLAYASWPLPPNVLGFLCLWAPWFVLLQWTLRRREELPLAPFALGLGLWVLLQAGALAWSRAGLSGLVSARYTEVLAWGFVANASAVTLMAPALKTAGRTRIALWLCAAIWFAAIGASEAWRSRAIYRPYLEGFRQQTLEHERRLEAFTATGDAGVIRGVEFPHIPGSAEEIISLLRDAKVRALLPGPLRRGLPNGPTPSAPAGDGPLAVAAACALRSGPWVASAGSAMLLAGLLLSRVRRRAEKLPAGPP